LPVIGFVEISYFNDSAFLLRHIVFFVIVRRPSDALAIS
jgi:hypothetical protein